MGGHRLRADRTRSRAGLGAAGARGMGRVDARPARGRRLLEHVRRPRAIPPERGHRRHVRDPLRRRRDDLAPGEGRGADRDEAAGRGSRPRRRGAAGGAAPGDQRRRQRTHGRLRGARHAPRRFGRRARRARGHVRAVRRRERSSCGVARRFFTRSRVA